MPPARRPKPARAYQQGPHLFRRDGRPNWYARGGSLPKDGVSLGTEDRAEAERRLRERLDLIARGPVDAPAREIPLSEAVERYLDAHHGHTEQTLRTTRNRLIAFGRWAGKRQATHPSHVTVALLDTWVTERAATTSRRTINRDLRAVRVCLRWAAERGLCARAAAVEDRKDLREPTRPQRREIPTPEEWRRILDACGSPRARAALAALLSTGLRIEELRRLHVGSLRREREGWAVSVEPEAGAAAEAWTTKGYRARTIPLTQIAADAVTRYLAVARGPRGAILGESWLLRLLRKACDAARVPRAGVHDTRRAFVTECHRSGVPIAIIARWCGHADVRTTEGYLSSYRTDRTVVAPAPGALAESWPNPGASQSPRGPILRHLDAPRRLREKA